MASQDAEVTLNANKISPNDQKASEQQKLLTPDDDSNEFDNEKWLKYAKKNIKLFNDVNSIEYEILNGSSKPIKITCDNGNKYVLKSENNVYKHKSTCWGWSITKVNRNMEFRYKLLDILYNKCDIPVPKVIHLCINDSIIGYEWILMEYIDGKHYDISKESASIKKELRENIYNLVCKLHSINVENSGIKELFIEYGFNMNNDIRNSSNFINHYKYFHDMNTAKKAAKLYTKLHLIIMNFLLNHDDIINKEKNMNLCLCHNDIQMSNIIWDNNNNIKGLIDWEYSDIGINIFDMSWLMCCIAFPSGLNIKDSKTEMFNKYIDNKLLNINNYNKNILKHLSEYYWNYYIGLHSYKFCAIIDVNETKYTEYVNGISKGGLASFNKMKHLKKPYKICPDCGGQCFGECCSCIIL